MTENSEKINNECSVTIWMPLVIGDFMKATAHLPAAAVGTYVRLLAFQWNHGAIPADPSEMQHAALVMSEAEFSASWGRIRHLFEDDGCDGMIHPALAIEREKAMVRRQTNKTRAEKGGAATRAKFANERGEASSPASSWAPSLASTEPNHLHHHQHHQEKNETYGLLSPQSDDVARPWAKYGAPEPGSLQKPGTFNPPKMDSGKNDWVAWGAWMKAEISASAKVDRLEAVVAANRAAMKFVEEKLPDRFGPIQAAIDARKAELTGTQTFPPVEEGEIPF